MENESNRFNGYCVFMAAFLTILFFSLKVNFWVSFVSALILCVVIRGTWILYNLILKLIRGINIERKEKKRRV